MFNAISWQSYWTALAILATLYYAVILLLYYRQDLKTWLQHKKASVATAAPATHFPHADNHQPLQPSPFEGEPDFHAPLLGTEEHTAYACMDELNAFFEAARGRKWSRPELLQALRTILSKYPSLKGSDYKESMGRVIVTQCEHDCSIHLKAEDLVGLWL